MPITTSLEGRAVLIMATHGFEQSELEVPLRQLSDAGAYVEIASLEAGPIRGWQGKDWGKEVSVDLLIREADPDDYDALVLPGGQINPDLLRVEDVAISVIRRFHAAGKPIAAICHAPWLLIEAELVKGRTVTGYKSILTDIANAGARVVDQAVVVDDNLVTSRCPDDLEAFCSKIADLLTQTGEEAN